MPDSIPFGDEAVSWPDANLFWPGRRLPVLPKAVSHSVPFGE
ncbi:MAG: hypothetical protein ACOYYJ_14475 [Chloroflexota bacterium]